MNYNEKEDFSQFGKAFQENMCQLILYDREFADQMKEVLNINFLELAYLQVFVKKIFDYKEKYDNTISDIQEKIIARRGEFNEFDHIFTYLYDIIIDKNNEYLMSKRKLVRVFLHYMYYYCHIGQKVIKNVKS